MATVSTWKNSPFAVPLCTPLQFHNVGNPDFDSLERCLCVEASGGFDITQDCTSAHCPDGLPLQWRVTANVTDNGCCANPVNCTQYDSWVLVHALTPCGVSFASSCCWAAPSGDFPDACGGGSSSSTAQVFTFVQEEIDGEFYYVLRTGSQSSSAACGADIVRYRILVDDFDCDGPNILTKYLHTFFPSEPCNWPDTVLLEPEP